jgi:hypothetical protein
MNQAAHGLDVDAESAREAVDIGTVFLAELRNQGGSDAGKRS